MTTRPPVLFLQPQGLTVTGITTWAVRLAGELARAGRLTGIVVHGSARGHGSVECPIPEGVRVFRHDDLPPIDALEGDVAPIADAYADAAARMGSGPVCVIPTRHGDCFGACAELTRRDAGRYRVIGWQHVATAYEDRLIERYEPVFSRLVGVSTYIAERLRARLPHRAADVCTLLNAADAAPWVPARPPLDGRPIRIVYTGRLEHEQKRVRALIAMSDALRAAGVAHELTAIGDGPGASWFDHAARTRPGVIRVGAIGPALVQSQLDGADVFVLASRTEGLSISLLEAMGRGCVPVITETPSGSRDAVEDGVSGVLVPFDNESDEAVGALLAAGVQRAIGIGLGTLGAAAWKRVKARFNPDRIAGDAGGVLDAAARAEPRAWPSDEPAAFSAAEGASASGSVPPEAAELLALRLGALLGRRVAIHGTGAHTRQLRPVLARTPNLVAFIDDDPSKAGSDLWGVPVVTPDRAAELGVTDVVISSWMHEDSIWSRRAPLESAGVRVHRLYAPATADAA